MERRCSTSFNSSTVTGFAVPTPFVVGDDGGEGGDDGEEVRSGDEEEEKEKKGKEGESK
jgi:hypothetical protein